MKLKKIFLKKILTIITISAYLFFSSQIQAAQPVSDFRLNTAINQSNNYVLNFSTIGLETGPYVSYGIDFSNNYYVIKILDKNNTELFSGKTLKSYQDSQQNSQTVIINPLNLYLPYFNEATKVQLFDENNSLKLEINLANHNLVGLKYRYTACDLCGYCPPDKLPSSWESCRKCLYPSANPTPTMGDTLRITDPSTNDGPTPFPEKTYTGIGCIGSTPEKASQAVLNIIFSIVGGLAFLALMYGGFVVATSQAEAERLNYGKRIIRGAIIGVVVTLLSAFIVKFIAS